MDISSAHSDVPQLNAPPTTASISSAVRVVIPNAQELIGVNIVTPIESDSLVADNSIGGDGSKEKTGRWTETEHLLFLEGLEKHGKQWKTIAGMIGTRTVVQVRTHAQKYFQKMDRKQNASITSTNSNEVSTESANDRDDPPFLKRKSLPGSMPSSDKKKSIKTSSFSLSGGQTPCSLFVSEHPDSKSCGSIPELLTFSTSNLSKSSSSGSDAWSTVSPNNVISELMDLLTEKSDSIDVTSNEGQRSEETVASFDFQDLGEDPLEWLVDIDSHEYLPESSLPTFPELAVPLSDSALESKTVVDLGIMVDPKVTLQSFLHEDDDLEQ